MVKKNRHRAGNEKGFFAPNNAPYLNLRILVN